MQVEQKQRLISKVFNRISKKLEIKVDDVEFKGEKLRTHLKFLYHTAYKIGIDKYNSSAPFPSYKVDKINHLLRLRCIIHDLKRKDNKRNYTLCKDTQGFILITSAKQPEIIEYNSNGESKTNKEEVESWCKEQQKEREWINKNLNPELYSSIEQSDMQELKNNISTYQWEETDDVQVSSRLVKNCYGEPSSFKPIYLRSTGNFEENSKGEIPKFLYFVVDKLSDLQYSNCLYTYTKILILSELFDLTPIIVSKSKLKYFSSLNGHVRFTQELFDETVQKENNLKKIQLLYTLDQKRVLEREYSFISVSKYFPELIKQEFKIDLIQKVKYSKNWYGLIGNVVSKIDKKTLQQKWVSYLKFLYSKYPLLKNLNFDNYKLTLSKKECQHIRLYMEIVDSTTMLEDHRGYRVKNRKKRKLI